MSECHYLFGGVSTENSLSQLAGPTSERQAKLMSRITLRELSGKGCQVSLSAAKLQHTVLGIGRRVLAVIQFGYPNARWSDILTHASSCHSWKLVVSGLHALQLSSDFCYATQRGASQLFLFIFIWAIKSSSLHHKRRLNCFFLFSFRVDGYRR